MLRAKCNGEKYCSCCCRQLQGFGALRVHSVRRLHHPLPPPLIRRAVNVPLHRHHTTNFHNFRNFHNFHNLQQLHLCACTLELRATCAPHRTQAAESRVWLTGPKRVLQQQAVGKAHDAPHNSTEQVECNHTHQLPATHCVPEKHLARAHNGGQLQASSSPPTSMLRQPQGTVGERGRRGRVGITNVTSPAGTLLSPVTLTANLRSCACMRA